MFRLGMQAAQLVVQCASGKQHDTPSTRRTGNPADQHYTASFGWLGKVVSLARVKPDWVVLTKNDQSDATESWTVQVGLP